MGNLTVGGLQRLILSQVTCALHFTDSRLLIKVIAIKLYYPCLVAFFHQ